MVTAYHNDQPLYNDRYITIERLVIGYIVVELIFVYIEFFNGHVRMTNKILNTETLFDCQ